MVQLRAGAIEYMEVTRGQKYGVEKYVTEPGPIGEYLGMLGNWADYVFNRNILAQEKGEKFDEEDMKQEFRQRIHVYQAADTYWPSGDVTEPTLEAYVKTFKRLAREYPEDMRDELYRACLEAGISSM